MKSKIQAILAQEIKPTMGCTDPGAVAYAAAKAAAELRGELTAIQVTLSPNTYKNALYVGLPGLKTHGIGYAALLGALIRAPQMKLEVLSAVDEAIMQRFNVAKAVIPVQVDYRDVAEPLLIEVTCFSGPEVVKVLIQGDYDHIVRIQHDEELILEDTAPVLDEAVPEEELRFEEIYHYVMNADLPDLAGLTRDAETNKQAFLLGMAGTTANSETNIVQNYDAIAGVCREYVYYASRMRMSGESVPIVSVAGSGNLGIISMLTAVGIGDCLNATPERKARAVALSVLVAIYIKSYLERTTVMCGSAIAGGCGGSAAAAYLSGGDRESVQQAIGTTLVILTGVLCDGAKDSCAFKVAAAAETGVHNGLMAARGRFIPEGSGILQGDLDLTVKNIAKVNNKCMKEVNRAILGMIQSGVNPGDRKEERIGDVF